MFNKKKRTDQDQLFFAEVLILSSASLFEEGDHFYIKNLPV